MILQEHKIITLTDYHSHEVSRVFQKPTISLCLVQQEWRSITRPINHPTQPTAFLKTTRVVANDSYMCSLHTPSPSANTRERFRRNSTDDLYKQTRKPEFKVKSGFASSLKNGHFIFKSVCTYHYQLPQLPVMLTFGMQLTS